MYKVDTTNVCADCQTFATSCDDGATQVDAGCEAGYYINSSDRCTVCPDAHATACDDTTGDTSECEDGWDLIGAGTTCE